jgi:O-antigen/teichoic acid export membrane protein
MLSFTIRKLLAEKKIFWSLAVRVGSALLLLGSSIVLARALGIDGFGTYSLALAALAVLQMPATSGAYTLVVRETSAGVQKSDFAMLRGLWHWSSRFVVKLSLGVLAVAVACLLLFDARPAGLPVGLLFIVLLAIPVVSWMRLYSARLRGLGLVIFSQLPEQLMQPGLMLLLVFGWSVLAGAITSIQAMAIYLATSIAILGVLAAVFARVKPDATARGELDQSQAPAWRRALIPLAMLSGLQVLNAQSAILLLGAMGDVKSVAEIKLATSLAIFGTFAAQVVTSVLGPDFAKAKAGRDVHAMRSLARRSVGMSALAALPILLVMGVFAKPILMLAYGLQYAEAAAAVTVLTLGYGTTILFGACSMILAMTGGERMAVAGHTAGLVVTLVLLAGIAPTYGSLGAAIAIATGMIVSQVFLLVNVVRSVHIDPTIVGLLRHVVASAGGNK